MALYDTKILFIQGLIFGELVQKEKKEIFGKFSKDKKPIRRSDVSWMMYYDDSFWEGCAPALVCRYGKPNVQREYAQERRRLCQKERKYSLR